MHTGLFSAIARGYHRQMISDLDRLADALRASGGPPFQRNAKGNLVGDAQHVAVMRASGELVFRLSPERVDELCAAGVGERYRGTMREWLRCPELSSDDALALDLAREALGAAPSVD